MTRRDKHISRTKESIRDVSDSEAGLEGGAATFKTRNQTTEIALQLDDGCLTSEVVRNSAVERGDTDEVKNELKDGYKW